MKKFSIGILLGLMLFVVAGIFVQRHAFACQLLPFLNYTQIHDRMFVDSELSSARSAELLQMMVSARQRMGDIYGSPDSEPRILMVPDAETAHRWGANETASMHRAPWGACIVVGPKGQNVDVLAHEWMHAEIQHRVGLLRFLREIPVWFDEGVGLTLDYREPFLPLNIELSDAEIKAVQRLESGREFFSGDIRQNYQAARMAVIPLIQNDRFYADLERIAKGETFEHVFLVARDSGSSLVDEFAD